MVKVTEAQRRASKKWDEKNRARKSYITRRSSAKSFILNLATEEDLDAILSYVEERRRLLEELPEKSPKRS